MATWPLTLPTAPDTQGYSETAPDTLVRTSMDAGPPKVRQRFTAGVRPITLSWMLTRDQVNTLDLFYVSTLRGGSLSFDGLVDPRTLAIVNFRFTAPPQYAALSPEVWRATTQLEIVP